MAGAGRENRTGQGGRSDCISSETFFYFIPPLWLPGIWLTTRWQFKQVSLYIYYYQTRSQLAGRLNIAEPHDILMAGDGCWCKYCLVWGWWWWGEVRWGGCDVGGRWEHSTHSTLLPTTQLVVGGRTVNTSYNLVLLTNTNPSSLPHPSSILTTNYTMFTMLLWWT